MSPCAPTVPAGAPGIGAEGAGTGVSMLAHAVGNMADEKLARLRQHAEHCRRLALDLYDDKTISALLKMAQEYDEAADELIEQRRRIRRDKD